MKRALLAVAVLLATTASARADLTVFYNFPYAEAASIAAGANAPSGANDWSCHPSAAHPRPVILVHGTLENQRSNWGALSPLLKNNGYCVYTFNYGGSAPTLGQFYGLAAIENSAAQLGAFVDQVRASTGAAKVDLVGHSQGGMMPRYYLKNLGGGAYVNALVALSPSNHGTYLSGLTILATEIGFVGAIVSAASPACSEQIHGSAFNTALDAGGDTVANVKYTVIATRYDEVITPYTASFLSGTNVTNITLQTGCAIDFGDHLAISYDRRALAYVLNALDPAHPRSVPCAWITAGIGG